MDEMEEYETSAEDLSPNEGNFTVVTLEQEPASFVAAEKSKPKEQRTLILCLDARTAKAVDVQAWLDRYHAVLDHELKQPDSIADQPFLVLLVAPDPHWVELRNDPSIDLIETTDRTTPSVELYAQRVRYNK